MPVQCPSLSQNGETEPPGRVLGAMLGRIKLVFLGALFSVFLAQSEPVSAQIKFEFEGGDQLAIAYLESQGYTDVRILANEFIQVRVEACKDGVRYRFKVRIDGRIFDVKKIGGCGALTVKQIRKLLRDAGYRKIEISEQDNRFVAFGCRSNDRFRIILKLNGEIRHTKRVGTCQKALSRGEIAAILRNQGFDGIDFQQSEPQLHVVHACLGRAKFRLELDLSGNIRSEERIGLCDQEISPRDIPAILAGRGFSRVEVIDDQLPGYVAIACKDGNRIEVTLNRFGRITKTKRQGRCAKRLSEDEITAILEDRGFRRINVLKADNRGYAIEACYKRRLLRMAFTVYGDFVSERDLGACKSLRVNEILEELEDRGVTDLEIYVEGCRGNRRLRFPIDDLGDRGKRERIGRC